MAVDLPALARELARSWGFEPSQELAGGHCSRIFADAGRVLKAPFAGEELTSGAAAAMRMADAGGPEVYSWDQGTGIVLMRRLWPGTDLASSNLADVERQQVFAGIADRVSNLDPNGAMSLGEYFGFDHPLLRELLETTDKPVFLHGDLHHYNILDDRGTWRPIDPKGLAGDRHFECVAYLRNPVDDLRQVADLAAHTESRLLSLAHRLDLDPWRVAAWGYLDNLESAYSEDHPWGRLGSVYQDIMPRLRPQRTI